METTPTIIQNRPWVVVDGDYDSLEIHDAKGEFVCSPCGKTLADVIDRASIIASAPQAIAKAQQMTEIARELIQIAKTINEFASGPIPWGGCRCDHGVDGRVPLRGEKCGRCKALERLKEIEREFGGIPNQDKHNHKDTDFGQFK